MSWSTQAVGRAAAVAVTVEKNLSGIHCSEPEESIKNKVTEIVRLACASFPSNYAVKVTASGSQGTAWDAETNKPIEGKVTNTVRVEIDPIWGFVE